MATTYYVKNGGNDALDGKSDANAWETLAKVTSELSAHTFTAGDNILFNRGDTFAGQILCPQNNYSVSGTADNRITVGAYGTGDNPIFDGSATIAGAWIQYGATSIYSTSLSRNLYVLTENDTRLRRIYWDTDIATTSADMYAGSWTHDSVNDILYVWTSDNTDPTTDTISYDNYDRGIQLYWWNYPYDYWTIKDITFHGYHIGVMVGNYNSPYWCDYTILENCYATHCDMLARIEGEGLIIRNNTVVDCGGYDLDNYNNGQVPGIMVGHGSNMEIYGNSVTDQWGIGIEINWNCNYAHAYDNVFIRCERQGIEIWDDSNYTTIERNYIEDCGAVGLKFSMGSSYAICRNNIINGHSTDYWGGGIGVSGSDGSSYGTANKIYNNIIINTNTSSSGALYTANLHTNNKFYNNIVYETQAYCANFAETSTISNNNCYYRVNAGNAFVWGDTTYTYANFANYQTASGQDANSITADPLFRSSTDYHLTKNSPCINAGTSLVGTVDDDYEGNPRPMGGSYDIGCYEYSKAKIRNSTIKNATL
jgi:hypothetical protein